MPTGSDAGEEGVRAFCHRAEGAGGGVRVRRAGLLLGGPRARSLREQGGPQPRKGEFQNESKLIKKKKKNELKLNRHRSVTACFRDGL